MKKYIISALFILASGLSANASAVSLDVSQYQFVTSASTSDAFGQLGSTSVTGAITDVDLSSFVYVPSSFEFPNMMTMNLSFSGAVADHGGTDLSFFFVGGGTSNSMTLNIAGTSISYGASEVLYTDPSQAFAYTAVTGIGEFALSAIFVDLNDFGVSSMNSLDITLSKGTYLALVAADPVTVAAVPVPAAVWLFMSGCLAMVGVARRKA